MNKILLGLVAVSMIPASFSSENNVCKGQNKFSVALSGGANFAKNKFNDGLDDARKETAKRFKDVDLDGFIEDASTKLSNHIVDEISDGNNANDMKALAKTDTPQGKLAAIMIKDLKDADFDKAHYEKNMSRYMSSSIESFEVVQKIASEVDDEDFQNVAENKELSDAMQFAHAFYETKNSLKYTKLSGDKSKSATGFMSQISGIYEYVAPNGFIVGGELGFGKTFGSKTIKSYTGNVKVKNTFFVDALSRLGYQITNEFSMGTLVGVRMTRNKINNDLKEGTELFGFVKGWNKVCPKEIEDAKINIDALNIKEDIKKSHSKTKTSLALGLFGKYDFQNGLFVETDVLYVANGKFATVKKNGFGLKQKSMNIAVKFGYTF